MLKLIINFGTKLIVGIRESLAGKACQSIGVYAEEAPDHPQKANIFRYNQQASLTEPNFKKQAR